MTGLPCHPVSGGNRWWTTSAPTNTNVTNRAGDHSQQSNDATDAWQWVVSEVGREPLDVKFSYSEATEEVAMWEIQPMPSRILEERIRTRAYELYEQRGKRGGHALDDWLQAELELSGPKALPQKPRVESPSLSEAEFKRRIYEKYKGHFDHFYRLHQLAEWALVEYGALTKDEYHATVQLILPRALKSFDSIRRLCEIASSEDAAVILRSLLNLLAVTRWISVDSKKRAEKYLAWYWVQMHRDAEFFADVVPSEFIADIEKHYDRVKPQFEYKDGNGKIRMPKQWYQPEVHSIFDMFKEVGLEKQYEEGYKPLSGIEHSDCMSYFAMLREAERSDGKTQLAVQSEMFVPHYLRNAFQYFADIFRICNQTMALADPEHFEKIVTAGIAFYKTDMKVKGLNP